MSINFEERNIFIDINKEIRNKYKNNKEEMYKNIPDSTAGNISIGTSIAMPLTGVGSAIAGSASSIGVGIGIKNNILKKINSNSKNLSNFNVESGEWAKNLKTKNLDELVGSIKFNKFSIQHYLNNIREYKKLTKKEIAQKSNYKEKYLEGVFTIANNKSKRNPSRDCIIGLSFAFDLNVVETCYLLKTAGYNELYLRNRRDLIIAKCLLEQVDVKDTNKNLNKYDESIIGNRSDEGLDLEELKDTLSKKETSI